MLLSMEQTYIRPNHMYSAEALSAFVVADSSTYSVVDNPSPECSVVTESPAPSLQSERDIKLIYSLTKPCLEKVNLPKKKHHWNDYERQIAIRKAKEMGLTKATRFLQTSLPTLFAGLSASTLQYWIRKPSH
ncbi:hypothetical protein EIN_032550 [Entamoeba invadens IP1]|uniref:Uncharacterized protein n=1 Tax=Entamoeba invadens IP1 TaxID=370355 RepID=A0A0A1TYB3_ENTIV|nr:hypothetical protein EIN_032550 [Entamoeba invadens IP1]ELP86464.1 hypothetical protein EIN_032550 [Entamoeba invadens IP1]|eukprot:XP_004185810.1 hypothetical protein EIN_032550 [Entamoeba invadens IP1]